MKKVKVAERFGHCPAEPYKHRRGNVGVLPQWGMAGLLGVMLIAAGLSAGCGWHSAPEASPPLSMFTDIPLPPELVIDEKNSQVYEHPVGRVGLLKASGRLSCDAGLSFFREAMLQNGWIKDSEFDNGDQRMLIFSKAPRSAAVTIKEGWISTEVEINVSAKQQ